MTIQLFDLALRVKNVLTPQECETLINQYEKRRTQVVFEDSIDPEGYKKTASFRAIALPKNSPTCELVRLKTEEALKKWIKHLKSMDSFHTFGLALHLKYAHQFRLLKYNTGANIHQHVDQGPGLYASVTLNLNTGYEGGELVFFNGKHVVSLEQGEAFVFPNDFYWMHETKPIITGVRYATNTFIGCSPHNVERLRIDKSSLPVDFDIK